ncbi:hypothetical protein PMAYCL1PPCAC_19718, partial [Pristionchus mayeri]
ISRACRACHVGAPLERHFCKSCRYAVCRECACRECASGACPLCMRSAPFIRLFEDSSLQCDICLSPEPVIRAVFTGCGHIVCGACAHLIVVDAKDKVQKPACPFCRVVSYPLPIKEQLSYSFSESEPLSFSRACQACRTEEPSQRFFATSCWHVSCSGCAEGAETCPICATSTSFVRIFDGTSRACTICLCTEPLSRSLVASWPHCVHCVHGYDLSELRSESLFEHLPFLSRR